VSATTTPYTHEMVYDEPVTRLELQHGLLDDSLTTVRWKLVGRHQYRRYTAELRGEAAVR
jgi:hypothetical protein